MVTLHLPGTRLVLTCPSPPLRTVRLSLAMPISLPLLFTIEESHSVYFPFGATFLQPFFQERPYGTNVTLDSGAACLGGGVPSPRACPCSRHCLSTTVLRRLRTLTGFHVLGRGQNVRHTCGIRSPLSMVPKIYDMKKSQQANLEPRSNLEQTANMTELLAFLSRSADMTCKTPMHLEIASTCQTVVGSFGTCRLLPAGQARLLRLSCQAVLFQSSKAKTCWSTKMT